MKVSRFSLQARIDRVLAPHIHLEYELHYVIDGRARFELDGRLVAIGPGDLFYTLPGSRHRMRGGTGRSAVLQYVALFEPDAVLARDLRTWPPGETVTVGLGWQVLFHALERRQQGRPLHRRLVASRLAALLYEILTQRHDHFAAPPPSPVEAMLQHIQTNLERAVDMAELAAVADLDPAYATRLFKRHLGVPPIRYATALRLERAATWLRDTDEPIHAIAERVGYTDPYHFSRAFKRWSGRAPDTYRHAPE